VDIGEGLAEGFRDAFGKGSMGGSADEFHGQVWHFATGRRDVDRCGGEGNTLRTQRRSFTQVPSNDES
jgi:hypothetical protein